MYSVECLFCNIHWGYLPPFGKKKKLQFPLQHQQYEKNLVGKITTKYSIYTIKLTRHFASQFYVSPFPFYKTVATQ